MTTVESRYLRNVISGEIVSIISTCSDDTIEIRDSIGKSARLKCEREKKSGILLPPSGWKYEYFDYSQLLPHIINFAKINRHCRDIFDILARRMDPDYFQVGVVVYLINPTYFQGHHDTYIFEPTPLMIRYIVPDRRQSYYTEGSFSIHLCRYPGKDVKISDALPPTCLEIPLNTNYIEDNDAYSSLKRFDKPY